MDRDLRPQDRHALELALYAQNRKKRLRYMLINWLVCSSYWTCWRSQWGKWI